jgi:hypothetical protein
VLLRGVTNRAAIRDFRTFFLDEYTELPYIGSVHTIIETPAFIASAEDEGISEDERWAIASYIAAHPLAGKVMTGTGGARKARVGGRGKGKSGGYRVITFYGGDDIPVFLLDVYSKASQANLSKGERNELRKVLTALPQAWREEMKRRIVKLRRGSS